MAHKELSVVQNLIYLLLFLRIAHEMFVVGFSLFFSLDIHRHFCNMLFQVRLLSLVGV